MAATQRQGREHQGEAVLLQLGSPGQGTAMLGWIQQSHDGGAVTGAPVLCGVAAGAGSAEDGAEEF